MPKRAWLFAGQSNMQGGIRPGECDQLCQKWPQGIELIEKEGPLDPPSLKTLGPELGFALELVNLVPEAEGLFIKHATGGTNLANEWSIDGRPRVNEDPDHNHPCWENFLKSFEIAGKLTKKPLQFEGFFWMQGERDSTLPIMAKTYATHLQELFERVRELTQQPKLPIIIGRITPRQMNQEGTQHRHQFKEMVRQAQVDISESDPHAAWVDADDLPQRNDALHFSAPGSIALGRRMARSWYELSK